MLAETYNVPEHPVEGRAQGVRLMGEKPPGLGRGIGEARARVGQGEGHVACLGGHFKLFEKANEVGVGPVVVYDEPRVHGVSAVPIFNIHGVGVAADVVVGFEK